MTLSPRGEPLPTHEDSEYVGGSAMLERLCSQRARIDTLASTVLSYDVMTNNPNDDPQLERGLFAAFRAGQFLVWGIVRNASGLYVTQHASEGDPQLSGDWRMRGCADTFLTPTGIGEGHMATSIDLELTQPHSAGPTPYNALENRLREMDKLYTERKLKTDNRAAEHFVILAQEGHNVWRPSPVGEMLEQVYNIIPPWR